LSFTIGISGTRVLARASLVLFFMLLTDAAMAQSVHGTLAGTSWQLVKFQGGDGTALTPDDGAKYTIEFGAGEQLGRT
jgi:hypothetical protein